MVSRMANEAITMMDEFPPEDACELWGEIVGPFMWWPIEVQEEFEKDLASLEGRHPNIGFD